MIILLIPELERNKELSTSSALSEGKAPGLVETSLNHLEQLFKDFIADKGTSSSIDSGTRLEKGLGIVARLSDNPTEIKFAKGGKYFMQIWNGREKLKDNPSAFVGSFIVDYNWSTGLKAVHPILIPLDTAYTIKKYFIPETFARHLENANVSMSYQLNKLNREFSRAPPDRMLVTSFQMLFAVLAKFGISSALFTMKALDAYDVLADSVKDFFKEAAGRTLNSMLHWGRSPMPRLDFPVRSGAAKASSLAVMSYPISGVGYFAPGFVGTAKNDDLLNTLKITSISLESMGNAPTDIAKEVKVGAGISSLKGGGEDHILDLEGNIALKETVNPFRQNFKPMTSTNMFEPPNPIKPTGSYQFLQNLSTVLMVGGGSSTGISLSTNLPEFTSACIAHPAVAVVTVFAVAAVYTVVEVMHKDHKKLVEHSHRLDGLRGVLADYDSKLVDHLNIARNCTSPEQAQENLKKFNEHNNEMKQTLNLVNTKTIKWADEKENKGLIKDINECLKHIKTHRNEINFFSIFPQMSLEELDMLLHRMEYSQELTAVTAGMEYNQEFLIAMLVKYSNDPSVKVGRGGRSNGKLQAFIDACLGKPNVKLLSAETLAIFPPFIVQVRKTKSDDRDKATIQHINDCIRNSDLIGAKKEAEAIRDPKAREQYQQFVAKQEQSFKYYQILGEIQKFSAEAEKEEGLGNYQKAIEHYVFIQGKTPAETEEQARFYARKIAQLKKKDEIVQYFKDKDPRTEEVKKHDELVSEFYNKMLQDNPQGVLNELETVELFFSKDGVDSIKASALFILKRDSELLPLLDKLERSVPATAALLRSGLYERQNQLDQAKKVLEIAHQKDPTNKDVKNALDRLKLQINADVTKHVVSSIVRLLGELLQNKEGESAPSTSKLIARHMVNTFLLVDRADPNIVPYLILLPRSNEEQRKVLNKLLSKRYNNLWDLRQGKLNSGNVQDAVTIVRNLFDVTINRDNYYRSALMSAFDIAQLGLQAYHFRYGEHPFSPLVAAASVLSMPVTWVLDQCVQMLEWRTNIACSVFYQILREVLLTMPNLGSQLLMASSLPVRLVLGVGSLASVGVTCWQGEFRSRARNALLPRLYAEIGAGSSQAVETLKFLKHAFPKDKEIEADLACVEKLQVKNKTSLKGKTQDGREVVNGKDANIPVIQAAEMTVVGMAAYTKYAEDFLKKPEDLSRAAYVMKHVSVAMKESPVMSLTNARPNKVVATKFVVKLNRRAFELNKEQNHQNTAYFYLCCLAEFYQQFLPKATLLEEMRVAVVNAGAAIVAYFRNVMPANEVQRKSLLPIAKDDEAREKDEHWLLYYLIRSLMLDLDTYALDSISIECFKVLLKLLKSDDATIKMSAFVILCKTELKPVAIQWMSMLLGVSEEAVRNEFNELEAGLSSFSNNLFVLSLEAVVGKLIRYFSTGELEAPEQSVDDRVWNSVKKQFFTTVQVDTEAGGTIERDIYRYPTATEVYDQPDKAILEGLWGVYLAIYHYKDEQQPMNRFDKELLDGAILRGFLPTFDFFIRKFLVLRGYPYPNAVFQVMKQFAFESYGLEKLYLMVALSSSKCELYHLQSNDPREHRQLICKIMRACLLKALSATKDLEMMVVAKQLVNVHELKVLLAQGADPHALVASQDYKGKPLIHVIVEKGWDHLFATLYEFGADFNILFADHTPLEYILQQICNTKIVVRPLYLSFWMKLLNELCKYVALSDKQHQVLGAYYFTGSLSAVLKSSRGLYDYFLDDAHEAVGSSHSLPFSARLDGTSLLLDEIGSIEIPGYEVVSVAGDGNCFFHAVARQMEGHDHQSLRSAATQYAIDHVEQFQAFLAGKSIDEFIDELSSLTEWVEHPGISALAYALHLNIMIYRVQGVEVKKYILDYCKDDHAAKVISLIYDGAHYHALIPVKAPGEIEESIVTLVEDGGPNAAESTDLPVPVETSTEADETVAMPETIEVPEGPTIKRGHQVIDSEFSQLSKKLAEIVGWQFHRGVGSKVNDIREGLRDVISRGTQLRQLVAQARLMLAISYMHYAKDYNLVEADEHYNLANELKELIAQGQQPYADVAKVLLLRLYLNHFDLNAEDQASARQIYENPSSLNSSAKSLRHLVLCEYQNNCFSTDVDHLRRQRRDEGELESYLKSVGMLKSTGDALAVSPAMLESRIEACTQFLELYMYGYAAFLLSKMADDYDSLIAVVLGSWSNYSNRSIVFRELSIECGYQVSYANSDIQLGQSKFLVRVEEELCGLFGIYPWQTKAVKEMRDLYGKLVFDNNDEYRSFLFKLKRLVRFSSLILAPQAYIEYVYDRMPGKNRMDLLIVAWQKLMAQVGQVLGLAIFNKDKPKIEKILLEVEQFKCDAHYYKTVAEFFPATKELEIIEPKISGDLLYEGTAIYSQAKAFDDIEVLYNLMYLGRDVKAYDRNVIYSVDELKLTEKTEEQNGIKIQQGKTEAQTVFIDNMVSRVNSLGSVISGSARGLAKHFGWL